MSGSQLLTGAVALVYLGVAAAHLNGGRHGMALTFVAYALANIGLILAERGR